MVSWGEVVLGGAGCADRVGPGWRVVLNCLRSTYRSADRRAVLRPGNTSAETGGRATPRLLGARRGRRTARRTGTEDGAEDRAGRPGRTGAERGPVAAMTAVVRSPVGAVTRRSAQRSHRRRQRCQRRTRCAHRVAIRRSRRRPLAGWATEVDDLETGAPDAVRQMPRPWRCRARITSCGDTTRLATPSASTALASRGLRRSAWRDQRTASRR